MCLLYLFYHASSLVDGAANRPQKEICCPPGTSCYLTALSISNIYCRPPMVGPISQGQPGCHPTFQFPPICLGGTQHCNYTQGGGCCPLGTRCTTDGCTDVVEFVFPSPSTTKSASTAQSLACDLAGCEGVKGKIKDGILPTSSLVPHTGMVAGTGTEVLQPATWTVTVTGSKTGEVCDPSAVATTGVASDARRRIIPPGWRIDGWVDGNAMLPVLMVGILVLAVGVLF